tara:strand:+ start:447 stop:878 length:432 start_codon:yes stop_codon:yes gene_type:complete
MALDIRIQRITKGANSGASTIHEQFKIQAQNFNVSYDRSPISAPLPGGVVLLYDLGQTRVNVSLDGIAAETDTNISEGGIMIADKDDLEAIAITQNWWNGIIRVIALGDEYEVAISSVKFALMAPVITRWTFNISMTGKLMVY